MCLAQMRPQTAWFAHQRNTAGAGAQESRSCSSAKHVEGLLQVCSASVGRGLQISPQCCAWDIIATDLR